LDNGPPHRPYEGLFHLRSISLFGDPEKEGFFSSTTEVFSKLPFINPVEAALPAYRQAGVAAFLRSPCLPQAGTEGLPYTSSIFNYQLAIFNLQ
jgi:hypothetical protein